MTNTLKYLVAIKHYGLPFLNNDVAHVVASGIEHHYVYIFDDELRAYLLGAQ